MLTPLLYRTWAKTRSFQLAAWTATWVREDLYATAQGTGAADAHMSYALRTEHTIHSGMKYAGEVTDLTQAFDRLLREVTIPIDIRAGFPLQLLRAWSNYVEHLRVTAAYTMGLGATVQRVISIPQGCPFSMRFLGMVVAPWCRATRTAYTIPRVLADDMAALCIGQDAAKRAVEAALETFNYATCMGGKVKSHKTWAFASHTPDRQMMRTVHFGGDRTKLLNVVLRHRDLGGQLELCRRGAGVTFNQRVSRAAKDCRSHARLPGTLAGRFRLAVSKYLPQALYGCETAPISLTSLRKLEAAICLLLLGRRGDRERCSRTPALVFLAKSPHHGATACPRYYIFYRRVMGIRRVLAKGTEEEVYVMQAAIRVYCADGRPGTYLPEEGTYTPWIRGGKLEGIV